MTILDLPSFIQRDSLPGSRGFDGCAGVTSPPAFSLVRSPVRPVAEHGQVFLSPRARIVVCGGICAMVTGRAVWTWQDFALLMV